MIGAEGPFSYGHRLALVDEYFGDRKLDPGAAWKDVYRLLLWADPTTGLAHCYESDKSQPGRPWYGRSLAFHAWLAEEFGVSATDLADELDWMFRAVIKRVADEEAARREALLGKAADQLSEYVQAMPVPGDEPELRQLIEPLLPQDPRLHPDDQLVREVLRQVRAYIGTENKRKNLLGRGFEDVLLGVVKRVQGAPARERMGTQTPIEQLRGFRAPRAGDKTEKVDLWIAPGERRVLVSAKWSVRSDREKQMRGDFLTYVASNEIREPFEYVWITNEFDPARLVANATFTEGNQYLFNAVVHICPDALKIVHSLERTRPRRKLAELGELLRNGRIVGLGTWLRGIAA